MKHLMQDQGAKVLKQSVQSHRINYDYIESNKNLYEKEM